MNRTLAMAAACLAALLPELAAADYLYEAFRDECQAQADHYYSAADPVISTVPLEQSETGRIGNNYLVYTGFRYHGDGDYRGHLYGIRLFYEKTVKGNDWTFTNTSDPALMTKCKNAALSATDLRSQSTACLFDAGQMLQSRTAARRIYTGKPETARIEYREADGGFTLQLHDLINGQGSAAVMELGTSGGAGLLASSWPSYAGLAPVSAAMPTWNGSRWDCGQLPNWVASTDRWCKANGGSGANNLRKPTSTQLQNLVDWLHGSTRTWKLADIYHSSAAIVEPPGYQYKDRFYPEFRKKLEKRPPMIYVGANDGMIHAFYAAPDLEYLAENKTARWKAGEEAWAYLPINMWSRALVAADANPVEQRFFSQDLSCRFTDVQVDRQYETSCDPTNGDDEYCGWRTVLLCGQGWGGSWFVALDVTDPRKAQPFKPLWEYTHLPTATDASIGLGRTWSLPAMSLVPLVEDGKTQPFWIATFGSGYNNTMRPATGSTKASYRALNMPFDGDNPDHGYGAREDLGHAYVLDVSSGKPLRVFHEGHANGPFVADGTVLDFDYDGFVDAAYMASYKGMSRIYLGANRASNYGMCSLPSLDPARAQTVLTGHPTAFAYRANENFGTRPVILVVGAGIDSGRDPDQQANQGNLWGINADKYQEQDGTTCPPAEEFCDLLWGTGLKDQSKKPRLLGAPLFSRQPSGDDWLLYTVWVAPHFNFICKGKDEKSGGNAHLLCMDVTLVDKAGAPGVKVPRCVGCAGYGDTGKLLYEDLIQPPSAPVSADGMVYITDPAKGLMRTGITDSKGGGPNANSNAPKAAKPAQMISWREVF